MRQLLLHGRWPWPLPPCRLHVCQPPLCVCPPWSRAAAPSAVNVCRPRQAPSARSASAGRPAPPLIKSAPGAHSDESPPPFAPFFLEIVKPIQPRVESAGRGKKGGTKWAACSEPGPAPEGGGGPPPARGMGAGPPPARGMGPEPGWGRPAEHPSERGPWQGPRSYADGCFNIARRLSSVCSTAGVIGAKMEGGRYVGRDGRRRGEQQSPPTSLRTAACPASGALGCATDGSLTVPFPFFSLATHAPFPTHSPSSTPPTHTPNDR